MRQSATARISVDSERGELPRPDLLKYARVLRGTFVAASYLMQHRWRLRFNLQEIDLRPGMITLGRAAECPITLDDPLVSRHHAQIIVSDTGCKLIDLGSRNGVRVNNVRITEPTELHANDRIRLGRDELVVLCTMLEERSEPGYRRTGRETGAQEICARCGAEHASGVVNCPRCGGTFPGIKLIANPSPL